MRLTVVATRILLAGCIGLLFCGPLAETAFAHATLVASDPADAAVLAEAPHTVTLRFSEPVTPLVARLIHPSGRSEILKDNGGGSSVSYALPGGLEHGTHILSWRVTSADGHPVGGGELFSIGAPSAAGGALSAQSNISVRIGLWASRLLLMLGLIFGVGSVAFGSFAGLELRPVARRSTSGLLLIGLLAVPGLIGFQGLDALGESFEAMGRTDVWSAGLWATAYGRSTLLAAVALLLALVAVNANADRSVLSKLSVLIALQFLGLAFASAGHASTAPPRFLTMPAVYLHTLSVAIWIGAFIPFVDALTRSDGTASVPLRRFAAVIPIVVLVVVVTGLLLATVQLGRVTALWTTGYGFVLLAKLALVALLFGLAALNRYRLTRGAIANEAGSLRRLRQSVLLETGLVVLIVGVLGLWRFTPPPRALAEAAAADQLIVVQKDGLSVQLTLHPAQVGPVTVEVADVQLDGKRFEPQSISIDLEKPAYGIGPFTHAAKIADNGSYSALGYVLPIDGFWVVRVTVLVNDFRSIILTDIFDVRKMVAAGNSFSPATASSQ